jgi:hypothetical protein
MTDATQTPAPAPQLKSIDNSGNQPDIRIRNEEVQRRREARQAKVAEGSGAPAPTPAPAPAPAKTPAPSNGQSTGDDAPQPGDAFGDDVPEWQKMKLEKLVRQKNQRDEKIKALLAENEVLRKGTAGAPSPQPSQTPTPTAATGKPTLAQFDNDVEKFSEALADWKHDQRVQENQRRVQEEARRKTVSTFKEREAKFMAEHDDYVETAYQSPVEYSPTMTEYVFESEHGPEVAYYLGSNLEEAKKISGLSPVQQAVALDRLAQKLSKAPSPSPAASDVDDDDEDEDLVAPPAPPARKVTKAPPPPAQVAAGSSRQVDPNEKGISTEERIRRWRAQGRGKRSRRG